MAKSDISVKLGLNSKEFDDNIKNSKRQIRKFKQDTQSTQTEIANSFKGMIKGAGAFSAALVGVNGVSAAFKTLLDSNQNFGDNWNNTLEGCKSVFSDFVTHLANADLSSFSANIANAYRAGVESGKAYDQLGNTKMSYGVASARKLDQLSDIDAQLSKETDSDKRKALIAERQQLITELRTFANTLSSDVINALSSSVNVGLGGVLSGDTSKVFSEDMFVKASEIDLDAKNRDSAKSAAEEFYKGFVSQINPMLKKIDNIRSSISVTERSQDFASEVDRQKRISQLNSQRDAELNKINALTTNLSETERQHLLNYITLFRFSDAQLQAAYNEMQGVYNSNRVISKIEKREPQAEKGGSSGGGSKTITKGNIKVAVSVDDPDEYDYDLLNNIWEGQQSINSDKRKNGASQALLNSEAFKGLSIFQDMEGIDNIESMDVSDQISQFTNLAGAIANVTGAVNNGASGWASWCASLMAAIGTAIPAIAALTAAKEAEAGANSKAAVTGAAASVASIPVVGWVMAGAAVASVIAAMASAPKFATGGIVGGGSVSGDKIPALLNSGEMVLNDRQQTNLFNQLNSGGGRSGNVNVTGELRLSGNDLIAAVKKNEKLNNRI